MAQKRRASREPSLVAVRGQIEHWRRTRTKRSPMPGQLWDAAAGLAERFGVRATAIGVCYKSLRKRLESTAGNTSLVSDASPPFVEVHPIAVAGRTPRAADSSAPIVLEVSGPTGQRLTIRLTCGDQLGAASALVRECWSPRS